MERESLCEVSFSLAQGQSPQQLHKTGREFAEFEVDDVPLGLEELETLQWHRINLSLSLLSFLSFPSPQQ